MQKICHPSVSIAIFMSEGGGDANFGPMFALIIGTAGGALIGLIVGAIIGDKKIFVLQPEYDVEN
jgi:hypothetical protein